MSEKLNIEPSTKLSITVEVNFVDGRQIIQILYPKSKIISIIDSAHLLASGVSLLIKSCSKNEKGIKDHELMKEVIDHITHEFSSVEAFEDSYVSDKLIKKEEPNNLGDL